MLDWIASIFQYPMQWFYTLTGDNYLLALILFSLFVKLLMLPLSIKQQNQQQRRKTLCASSAKCLDITLSTIDQLRQLQL